MLFRVDESNFDLESFIFQGEISRFIKNVFNIYMIFMRLQELQIINKDDVVEYFRYTEDTDEHEKKLKKLLYFKDNLCDENNNKNNIKKSPGNCNAKNCLIRDGKYQDPDLYKGFAETDFYLTNGINIQYELAGGGTQGGIKILFGKNEKNDKPAGDGFYNIEEIDENGDKIYKGKKKITKMIYEPKVKEEQTEVKSSAQPKNVEEFINKLDDHQINIDNAKDVTICAGSVYYQKFNNPFTKVSNDKLLENNNEIVGVYDILGYELIETDKTKYDSDNKPNLYKQIYDNFVKEYYLALFRDFFTNIVSKQGASDVRHKTLVVQEISGLLFGGINRTRHGIKLAFDEIQTNKLYITAMKSKKATIIFGFKNDWCTGAINKIDKIQLQPISIPSDGTIRVVSWNVLSAYDEHTVLYFEKKETKIDGAIELEDSDYSKLVYEEDGKQKMKNARNGSGVPMTKAMTADGRNAQMLKTMETINKFLEDERIFVILLQETYSELRQAIMDSVHWRTRGGWLMVDPRPDKSFGTNDCFKPIILHRNAMKKDDMAPTISVKCDGKGRSYGYTAIKLNDVLYVSAHGSPHNNCTFVEIYTNAKTKFKIMLNDRVILGGDTNTDHPNNDDDYTAITSDGKKSFDIISDFSSMNQHDHKIWDNKNTFRIKDIPNDHWKDIQKKLILEYYSDHVPIYADITLRKPVVEERSGGSKMTAMSNYLTNPQKSLKYGQSGGVVENWKMCNDDWEVKPLVIENGENGVAYCWLNSALYAIVAHKKVMDLAQIRMAGYKDENEGELNAEKHKNEFDELKIVYDELKTFQSGENNVWRKPHYTNFVNMLKKYKDKTQTKTSTFFLAAPGFEGDNSQLFPLFIGMVKGTNSGSSFREGMDFSFVSDNTLWCSDRHDLQLGIYAVPGFTTVSIIQATKLMTKKEYSAAMTGVKANVSHFKTYARTGEDSWSEFNFGKTTDKTWNTSQIIGLKGNPTPGVGYIFKFLYIKTEYLAGGECFIKRTNALSEDMDEKKQKADDQIASAGGLTKAVANAYELSFVKVHGGFTSIDKKYVIRDKPFNQNNQNNPIYSSIEFQFKTLQYICSKISNKFITPPTDPGEIKNMIELITQMDTYGIKPVRDLIDLYTGIADPGHDHIDNPIDDKPVVANGSHRINVNQAQYRFNPANSQKTGNQETELSEIYYNDERPNDVGFQNLGLLTIYKYFNMVGGLEDDNGNPVYSQNSLQTLINVFRDDNSITKKTIFKSILNNQKYFFDCLEVLKNKNKNKQVGGKVLNYKKIDNTKYGTQSEFLREAGKNLKYFKEMDISMYNEDDCGTILKIINILDDLIAYTSFEGDIVYIKDNGEHVAKLKKFFKKNSEHEIVNFETDKKAFNHLHDASGEPFLKKIPEIVEYRKTLSLNDKGYSTFDFEPAKINKKHYDLYYNRYITNAFWIVENLHLDLNIDNETTTTSELFFRIISKKLHKIYERLSSVKNTKTTNNYYKNISLILMMSTLKSIDDREKPEKVIGYRYLQREIKKHLVKNMTNHNKNAPKNTSNIGHLRDEKKKNNILEIKNKADGYLKVKIEKSMLYNKKKNTYNNLNTSKINKNTADVDSLRENFEMYKIKKNMEKAKLKYEKIKKDYSKFKLPEKKKKLFEIAKEKLKLYDLLLHTKFIEQKIEKIELQITDIKNKNTDLQTYKEGGDKYDNLNNIYKKIILEYKKKRNINRYKNNKNVSDLSRMFRQQRGGDEKQGSVDKYLVDFIENSNISGIF
jgi:hypothetical protein